MKKMAKKILVIVGSERPTGNSARLAEAFIEGAQQAGHEITRIDIGSIHGCIGCDRCLAPEHRFSCIWNDVMAQVYERYEEWDGVCVASPIYDFMISAQAKAFFDRLYACQFAKNRRKDAWLLLSAADLDEDVFDPTICWFRHAKVRMSGWTERGILKGYGIQHLGDADKKHPEYLDEARKMGREA